MSSSALLKKFTLHDWHPLSGVRVVSTNVALPPPPQRAFPFQCPQSTRASGKGWSVRQALNRCRSEAVERFSAVFRGNEVLTYASLEALSRPAVSPRLLLQFSDAQYASRDTWNVRFGMRQYIPDPWFESDPLDWTLCRNMHTDTEVLVPTAAIYLRYVPPAPKIFFTNDSIGCAAAPTREQAIVRGFLEVVERDAIAQWWYNRCARPEITALLADDHKVASVRNALAAESRSFAIFDLTTDFGIPVAAAVSATAKRECIVCGFGCHFDWRKAAHSACAELMQILGPPSMWSKEAQLEQLALSEDRRLWFRDAALDSQPHLHSSPAVAEQKAIGPMPATIARQLQYCVDAASAAGLDVLIADLTRLETGIPVVKVIVPGMCSVYPRFGSRRLMEAPVRQGWLSTPRSEAELNPWPFCF